MKRLQVKDFGTEVQGTRLSAAMAEALERIEWNGGEGVWYHDIGAPTAKALTRRGLVADAGQVECCTHGAAHAGYLVLTTAGRAACDSLREPA